MAMLLISSETERPVKAARRSRSWSKGSSSFDHTLSFELDAADRKDSRKIWRGSHILSYPSSEMATECHNEADYLDGCAPATSG